MIRNFLTTAWRNLLRNKFHGIINMMGLAIGISACLVIYLIVEFEQSFEKFHVNYNRVYRVTRTSVNASGTEYSSTTPYPFAAAFREDFPDIPLITQLHYHQEVLATVGTEKFKINNVIFADSLFFDVFTFESLSGNPQKQLGEPGKVFLTRSLADKILKDDITRIKLDNKLELEIAGILSDPPANSHIQFSMVVSMPSFTSDFIGLPIDRWGTVVSGASYVALPDKLSPSTVESRLRQLVEKYPINSESEKDTYHLQSLSDVHFNENYRDTAGGPAYINRSTLVVLGFLGGFILLIACINFVNLNTALAVKKSREIGVRKTLGASRRQLVFQYLSEAFMLTVISTVLAVIVLLGILPFISTFLSKELRLQPFDGLQVVFLAVLVFVTALLSGLYPAFVLSGFRPVSVLKNSIVVQGSTGAYARRGLVIFQFLVAQVLIIGTLVMAGQMKFLNSKPLGFTKEAILNITIPHDKPEQRELFYNLVRNIPGVEKMSFSVGAPVSDRDIYTGYRLTEHSDKVRYDTELKLVDKNYLETYGLELAAGRWFNENEEKLADHTLPKEQQRYSYIVNEALVRQLGFHSNEDIIGKNITSGLNSLNAEVVGVVKDFHTRSLHHTVKPVVMLHFSYFYADAGIRFNTESTQNVIKGIEEAFAKVYPEYLLNYSFFDAHLESLYQQEKRSFTLIRVFAGLAIFISCLGLLGLVSFLVQQKMKEVGIRKVLGASIVNIVFLFSKNFILLILIGFAVAVPLAWWIMNRWLQDFAYRVDLAWWMFVLPGVLVIAVALLTMSFQTIKAARANPVKSLRTE